MYVPSKFPKTGRANVRLSTLAVLSSAAFVLPKRKICGIYTGSKQCRESDITSYLKRGENRLAVQVFRWSDGSYLECQDMFRMSGIFRDVYIDNTPLVSVRDHYITASLDKQAVYPNGTMKVRLALDNRDRLKRY